jgi:carbamoyltransferase
MNEELPSIALHLWHNAAVSVYHKGEITAVVEFERLINQKNASFEFFEPIHSKDYILKEVYDYLNRNYGYTNYDKFVIGYGYPTVPQKFRDIFPANEYIVDESHHGSHASNGLYQSPYNKAIIISFDGGSNDGFFNIYIGEKGKELELIKYINVDLGSHYHAIGSLCNEVQNYHVLTAAGKVLGLQSYGKVIDHWKEPIKRFMSFNQGYTHRLSERIVQLSSELGIEFAQHKKLSGENSYNFARTAQEVFEEIFFEHANELLTKYSDLPIILAGGCALNITLNTKVKEKYNRPVFVAPNSSDCGLTVGLLCKMFKPTKQVDITYKGLEVLDRDSLMDYVHSRNGNRVAVDYISEELSRDIILGVVQGRSEHGPRALGNRSIICSPLSSNMKDILNKKVKNREWYRPFAPIVRLEDVSEYFEWNEESRWMNFCVRVKGPYKQKLLAITHVDDTARIQTVTSDQNPFMYNLLTEFKKKTGVGVLLNTSFNVNGKPILSTYRDAFKVFDTTQLDRLYLNGFYFKK